MAKNTLEQRTFFHPPTLVKHEGKVISKDKAGVNFRYRKPGSQTRITEFFAFNADNFYGLIGDVGKEGAIYIKGPSDVFGAKQRNELQASNVQGYSEGFVTADTSEGSIILNSKFVHFRVEDTSENSKGRGRSASSEKPAKKAKTEKAEKPAKKKKVKPAAASDWD